MSRGSRRQTIEIKLKIADRQKNPMLSFVTWNIRVTQLECARGASSVITGRHLNDTLPPMNPSMARTISEDANLLGRFILYSEFYQNFNRYSFALRGSSSWMFTIPHRTDRNNRIIQF